MTLEPILKVAFLDHDGTINVDRGFVHRIEDWEFTPSACQALALLGEAGFRIAIVTNQSGIAAGLYTVADAERLHTFMCQQLVHAGVLVDAIVYCPAGWHQARSSTNPLSSYPKFSRLNFGQCHTFDVVSARATPPRNSTQKGIFLMQPQPNRNQCVSTTAGDGPHCVHHPTKTASGPRTFA